ncbi:hypothetical protein HCA78_12925 [Listeria booriae]|uniref:Lipoprotein n=1 Tax=Listeria booriae TaxID=1552123 RepID=A0A842D0U4_9LIST|nr:hypothetical protein [Listeria booriae]MBC2004680.1 hypothetical protein [Listeria booriae]
MKKMLVLLGVLLICSLSLVACGESDKEFYDKATEYENDFLNTFNPIWTGSYEKIPEIDTFNNDYREEIIGNLDKLSDDLDEQKNKASEDKELNNFSETYVKYLTDTLSYAKEAVIELKAQVSVKGANSLDDDNFKQDIIKIKQKIEDSLEKTQNFSEEYKNSK